MGNIRIATRKTLDRNGLLMMLRSIFSDEDTNGNNGREYWRLSDDMCDDDYLLQLYQDESMSEIEVVRGYADYYMGTMNSFCNAWQDFKYILDDNNQHVMAISYANY